MKSILSAGITCVLTWVISESGMPDSGHLAMLAFILGMSISLGFQLLEAEERANQKG